MVLKDRRCELVKFGYVYCVPGFVWSAPPVNPTSTHCTNPFRGAIDERIYTRVRCTT
jgi:hypothetical protein